MSKVVVTNHLTLDGVMQAPGRPDEDRRGDFEHGGWAPPYGDSVMARVMGEGMARGGAMLLGRRTYEDFAAFWPKQKDNPFTAVLNDSQKYVSSRTLKGPPRGATPHSWRATPQSPWPGSRSSRARISWYLAAESWSSR